MAIARQSGLVRFSLEQCGLVDACGTAVISMTGFGVKANARTRISCIPRDVLIPVQCKWWMKIHSHCDWDQGECPDCRGVLGGLILEPGVHWNQGYTGTRGTLEPGVHWNHGYTGTMGTLEPGVQAVRAANEVSLYANKYQRLLHGKYMQTYSSCCVFVHTSQVNIITNAYSYDCMHYKHYSSCGV